MVLQYNELGKEKINCVKEVFNAKRAHIRVKRKS